MPRARLDSTNSAAIAANWGVLVPERPRYDNHDGVLTHQSTTCSPSRAILRIRMLHLDK